MKKRTDEYLLEAAHQIATVSAKEAGKLAYTANMMVNAAFPCRDLGVNEFVRVNGKSRLTILSPAAIGIPYGTYPRILLIWIVSQAKTKKTREIYLGESVSAFMRGIGKLGSGGVTGSLTALRELSRRLFSSTMCFTQDGDESYSVQNVSIAKEATVLWRRGSEGGWSSTLMLDEVFYEDILASAVPIDMRVIEACSHYPLAIDVYCWLTYRYFSLSRTAFVTWKQLAAQFGNVFSHAKHFKPKFVKALKRVSLFYPEARYLVSDRGLCLLPSPSHIPKNDNVVLLDAG